MEKRESPIAGGDEHHDTSSCAAAAALARDISVFLDTSKVPKKLDRYVRAPECSKLAWYKEMSKKLRDSKTQLQTPEDCIRIIWSSLCKLYPYGVDITYLQYGRYHLGLLEFYGLPHVPMPPDDDAPSDSHELLMVLETLPVTRDDQVTDGGGFTVFVEVTQYTALPSEFLFLNTMRHKVEFRDSSLAHELLNQINAMGDYKIVEIDNRELLTRKYQIRLRGMDGIEARDELLKMVNGERLKIYVYYLDDDGCCVGDVYCDDTFLQDKLLEKGFELHPDPELAEWDKAAQGMESKEDVLGMELELLELKSESE